jgi:hypothetical protein
MLGLATKRIGDNHTRARFGDLKLFGNFQPLKEFGNVNPRSFGEPSFNRFGIVKIEHIGDAIEVLHLCRRIGNFLDAMTAKRTNLIPLAWQLGTPINVRRHFHNIAQRVA